MHYLIHKFIKFAVFGFVPFLLISSSGTEITSVIGDIPIHNRYLIPSQISVGLDMKEEGSYQTLRLVFTDLDSKNSMELLLSGKKKAGELKEQVFVINHIDGFLDGFEGVFAVFTHQDFGEEPFFANEGFVKINSMKNDQVQGYMDLTLVNNYGKTIRISDNFRNF